MSIANLPLETVNPTARPGSDALILHEPANVYHAKAAHHLSSHALADFRKCPQLFFQKRSGLIVDEDRPAFLVGRAVHTLALEGKAKFDAEFAVGGPINEKTGQPFGSATKAFAEWAAQQGKPVLTEEQFALVQALAVNVRAHELAAELLTAGIPEGVVRTDYCGFSCQIRMDWFDPHQGIVDLKTCDDLTWFEADARRFGYSHQMAFYRAVLAQVIGVAMPIFFIAIEKKPPFRCGVWKVSDEVLLAAQHENEAAMRRLLECEASSNWPTHYEELRVFDGL